MSSGPGIVYKFSQQGIEDLTSKIKDLHQQFADGQITYKQYHSSIKEATSQGRAATSEFNEMKGAIAAANPNLLEFTRTMSLFGGVANTVLSVTNAINLAQMASSGIDTQVAQNKAQVAMLTNQVTMAQAAYGEGDARVTTLENALSAAKNEGIYLSQQQARESVTTAATLVASAISIVGSISNTIVGFKALQASMNPIYAEQFGVAMTAAGDAMMTIVAPIAVVIAAIEGINYAFGLLVPQFGSDTKAIAAEIQQNWNVDSMTAFLLAPFVQTYAGIVDFADESYNQLVGMYNMIINNIINPLIGTWDNTIGKITGQIGTVGNAAGIDMSNMNNKILASIGLGPHAAASSGGNPNADAINQMMVGSPTTSTAALNTLQQNTLYSGIISQGQQAANQYLNSILATGQAANQVAQNILQSQNANTQAVNAAKAAQQAISDNANSKIADLKAQVTQLLTQPQTQTVTQMYTPESLGSGDVLNFGTPTPESVQVPSDAANQVAALHKQIASLQQTATDASNQVAVLDNATSGLDATLSSIGLSSQNGIGSIIAGALGGAAGVGGAGINATQLAQFAATGNYGVFTQAANQDFASQSGTPTHQQQIDALLKSWSGMGLSSYTAADAAKALGYVTTPVSLGSQNVGSGAFGGLPGQYGNPSSSKSVFDSSTAIFAAAGFEGVVSGATKFVAGESGPEQVSITPLNSGRKSGATIINVTHNNAGTLLSENNHKDFIMKTVKEALKQGGF